jgi:hypothetical protein
MDRVRYLRLAVAVTVAVALAAAVIMSLVRSSDEKAEDHFTTPPRRLVRRTGMRHSLRPVPRGLLRPSRAPTRRPTEISTRRSNWSSRVPSRFTPVAGRSSPGDGLRRCEGPDRLSVCRSSQRIVPWGMSPAVRRTWPRNRLTQRGAREFAFRPERVC